MAQNSPETGRRGLLARWTGLLNEWEPGTSLALFRIACGLTVLCTLGTILFHGLAPVIWLDFAEGGYSQLVEPPWLFALLGGVNPVTLWSVIALAVLAGAATTVGCGGRVSIFVTLQTYMALSSINTHIGGCDDQLIGNALWLLVLSRSTATLSVDCRLRTGSWTSDALVPAWPRYLAIFQLVLVYSTTGLQKLSITWTPAGGYSALYYILQEPSWQRWDMSWLAWVYPLTQIMTAATWIWEVSSPLLLLALWYQRTRARPGRLRAFFNKIHFRELFIAVGVLMHLGVWLLIALGPFTWISLSFYACLFRPDEWKALAARLAGGRAADVTATVQRLRSPLDRVPGWIFSVLITFHVVAVTLMAIPAVPPNVMSTTDWESSVAQEEFASWAALFQSLGIDVTPRELQDHLWQAALTCATVRERVLTPFQWYYRYCHARQGWRMFTAPCLEPTRLYIDVDKGGQWRPVFGEGLRDVDWLGAQLNHEHMRTALYTMVFFDYAADLERLAQWLALRAGRDFPDATALRLRVHKARTSTPAETREGHRPVGVDRVVATQRLR